MIEPKKFDKGPISTLTLVLKVSIICIIVQRFAVGSRHLYTV